ncbi:MAG TPA: SUMF1/EgtB/PvdO family nonheme iron enzyme, partial [Phototrophicaceae bacterium]|nr:SUMF1/EgtB/PvdO family nonheme iron enzyme [Phototrophicaceae bacterium]
MPDPTDYSTNSDSNPVVFISYARADGADYSLRLYDALNNAGIRAWRDNRLDPALDFTGEIEEAINRATHVVVVVTPDLKRADSFVRLELGYALTQKKPIIPLMFPGGHRPIVIINHTYINFQNWDVGFGELSTRLKRKSSDLNEIDPETQRERELAYLQSIGQLYDHWRDLYTDLAANARIEQSRVNLKPAARRIIEMRHQLYQQIDHTLDADRGKTVKTENLTELREGLRQYHRVALIGDPGAGKTTTLERLAYEYAVAAAEEADKPYRQPLPLFVSLGAYTGDDFTRFLESTFGGFALSDYLPGRVVLLLDGLNEMPAAYHGKLAAWLNDHSDVAVIVSCRKLDYVELKLPLQRVDVSPLDLDRIRLFMGNYLPDAERETLFWALAGYDARRAWDWYRQRRIDATYRDFFTADDQPGSDWMPERKVLDTLRQQFHDHQMLPDMLGVVTNPFLMQIVIELYALTGDPPRNKGDLFGQFVTLLMAERGRTAIRPGRTWVAELVQKQALSALAYRMQSEHTGTFVSLDFVRTTFQQAVNDVDPDLLLYFAVSASILEQTDTIRFSHQQLQEYFAAYRMGEDLQQGVPATKYFPSEKWWTPTGWEETALFLAGMQGDATSVVEWLTPVQPDLAYRVATRSGATCKADAWYALYQPAANGRHSPLAVAAWGQLNHEQDVRPGVGLRPDGLPNLLWCDVPAGDFLYGSNVDRQTIHIPYAFKIAAYPVTFVQFQAFVNSIEYHDERWWGDLPEKYRQQPMAEQSNRYRNHPRDSVSWYQAVAFTRWLDHHYREVGLLPRLLDKTGQEVEVELRLPLEYEWEKAARGTDGRIYPWGNVYLPGYANIYESATSDGTYFLNQTTAVGIYPAGQSPYGVFDMSGNIWEWCLNDYSSPKTVNPAADQYRVLRGGSFSNDRNFVTCS